MISKSVPPHHHAEHAPQFSAGLQALRAAVLIAAAVLPMACSADNPITWLHEQQGGAIANERPPLPQADAPYPNIATVPAKPEPADKKARESIAKSLVTDRTNAQYTLSNEGMKTPPNTLPPNRPVAAAGGEEAAGASLQAATAPKSTLKLASAADPSASAAMTNAQKVLQPMRDARPAEALDTLPPLADAPPLPPKFAGVPGTTEPTPPKPAPTDFTPTPATAAKPASPSASIDAPEAPVAPAPTMDAKMTNVRLGFAPGDATLPGPALATLKMLAHQRGVRSMVVTGFGDVVSSDAAAQAAGLTLALSRARAVAAYLMAVGVPPAAVRITGQAQGQGAAVRLTN